MAEDNQKQLKPHEDPLNTGAIALDEANKTIRKKVAEGVDQGLDSNIPPEKIIQTLIQQFKMPQQASQNDQAQNVLQQLIDLSGSQVPTGDVKSRIGNFIRGEGFKQSPVTEDLGITNATKVMQLQSQQQQQQMQVPKQQLDMIKTMQDLLSGTPEGIRQTSKFKAEGQAQAQEAKEAAKTERNFKIAQEKLKLTYEKFDEAIKETEKIAEKSMGAKISGSGRIGGLLTSLLGATGKNPKVAGFQGQMIEASTAIAKIAAPSAKVGPELIKIFGKTLPKIGWFNTSTTEEAIDQSATSVTNAFINYVRTHPEDFPEGADFSAFRKQTGDMLRNISERSNRTVTKEAAAKPSPTEKVKEKAQKALTAVNKKTGERLQSSDGGKTWQPIQ